MRARKPAQRREALIAAKLAVRAYAREPSAANAVEVETAWHKVRQLDSVARWRQPAERARSRSEHGTFDQPAEPFSTRSVPFGSPDDPSSERGPRKSRSPS